MMPEARFRGFVNDERDSDSGAQRERRSGPAGAAGFDPGEDANRKGSGEQRRAK
jgi:hypothetical protein